MKRGIHGRLDEWKSVELFQRESRVLEKLDHTRIPDYVDHFTLGHEDAPDGFALVQEYVPGRTLRQLWRDGADLDHKTMLRWFVSILEVLAYLHERRPPVIHRDISPKNIMLREEDRACFLIDFGTVQAKLASASTVSSTAAGTFGYSAMEQFVGRALPASDLYGLAMTFLALHLRTEPENLPFARNRVQVQKALEQHPLDARMVLVLEAMTQPDAARRPQSAREVLERLGPLRDSVPAMTSRDSERSAVHQHSSLPDDDSGDAVGSSEVAVREGADADRSVDLADWDVSQPERDAARRAATEHWRRAKARYDRLPADRIWGHRPPLPSSRPDSLAVSADGSRALLVTYDACYVIDTSDMSMTTILEYEISGRVGAFSADGRRLAVLDGNQQKLHMVDSPTPVVSLPATVEYVDGHVAVSPDGELVAIAPEEFEDDVGILIYEWTTGERVQKLLPSVLAGSGLGVLHLEFSPTGDTLICTTDSDGVFLFDEDDARHFPKTRFLTHSPDGRLSAVARDGKLVVGELDKDTLYWKSSTRIDGHEDADRLRFSPDGNRLLVARQALKYATLHVYDLIDDERVASIDDLYRDGTLDRLAEFGLLQDSSRVMFRAEFSGSPLARSPSEEVGLYSVDRARPLGSVLNVVTSFEAGRRTGFFSGGVSQLNEDVSLAVRDLLEPLVDDQHGDQPPLTTPIWLTDQLFYGRLDGGRLRADGKPFSEAERPDLVRQMMAGLPPESLLGPEETHLWRDAMVRYQFILALSDEMDDSLREFLHASRGLSHLLPEVMRRATEIAQESRRFGVASEEALQPPSPALVSAAEELRERPEEQRQVIFEEMIQRLGDEATDRLERQAEQKRKAHLKHLEREERRAEREREQRAEEQKRAEERQRAEEAAAKKHAIKAAITELKNARRASKSDERNSSRYRELMIGSGLLLVGGSIIALSVYSDWGGLVMLAIGLGIFGYIFYSVYG